MRRPPAVARVLERATATSRTHHLFLPNQTALLAVSGGPDSVCLAETMVRLRRLLKVRFEIVHVDHGMREGSRQDVTYVRAARRSPPAAGPRAHVGGSPARGCLGRGMDA